MARNGVVCVVGTGVGYCMVWSGRGTEWVCMGRRRCRVSPVGRGGEGRLVTTCSGGFTLVQVVTAALVQ